VGLEKGEVAEEGRGWIDMNPVLSFLTVPLRPSCVLPSLVLVEVASHVSQGSPTDRAKDTRPSILNCQHPVKMIQHRLAGMAKLTKEDDDVGVWAPQPRRVATTVMKQNFLDLMAEPRPPPAQWPKLTITQISTAGKQITSPFFS
jgi:hypothetical protein